MIDFGSSCFTRDHLSSYVQSRSYRAPEVILGNVTDKQKSLTKRYQDYHMIKE